MDFNHTCHKDFMGCEFNGCFMNDYNDNPFINVRPSHMNTEFFLCFHILLPCWYTSLFGSGLCAHNIYQGIMIMVILGSSKGDFLEASITIMKLFL